VSLIDDEQGAVLARDLAQGGMIAGISSTMPTFVNAGSASTQAMSLFLSAASSALRSLNPTTAVVTLAGSTGGPTFPRRALATPSCKVIKVSSTVP
jgi:hypothetical protein